LWLTTALLLVVAQNLYAAAWDSGCVSNMRQSTPSSNFQDHGDGTITDLGTGLMWQKCSFGQSYNASTQGCDGIADTSLSWQTALQDAAASTTAGHSDWRMPNIKELYSIVETACIGPAINPGLFPATSTGYYWSATPTGWGVSGAWRVYFGVGTVGSATQADTGLARFVRDTQ